MARFFKPQKKSLDTQHKEFEILRFDHHGEGVALEGEKPVYISGALPGEKVIVQLIENKRHYAKAKLIKILQESPERIAPFCAHYGICGGCQLQHLNHEAQIEAKQETLRQITKKITPNLLPLMPPVICSSKGYRRRARFSVKVNKTGHLEMGFRQRNSKEIVTLTQCPVLEPCIEALIPSLYALLDSLKGRRIIGHIELVSAEPQAALLVRTVKILHKQDKKQLHFFAKEHDLILYLQEEDAAPVRLYGERPFYCIKDLKLQFEPQDFIQVNKRVNEKMVSQALEWLAIEPEDKVLDLFCGLGNFSLPLSQKAAQLVGIEGVEAMVERAENNGKINALQNLHFYHSNLEDDPNNTFWGKQKYHKILLDPARAGALELMRYVAKTGATRIVYVSCNPISLARDAQILINQGYRLEKMGMLDMFPHTGHLESMSLFIKI